MYTEATAIASPLAPRRPLPKDMLIDVESFKRSEWFSLYRGFRPVRGPIKPWAGVAARVAARVAADRIECEQFWSDANKEDPRRADADAAVARWHEVLEYSKACYAAAPCRAGPQPIPAAPVMSSVTATAAPLPVSRPMTLEQAYKRHMRAAISPLSIDGESFNIDAGHYRETALTSIFNNLRVPEDKQMLSIDRTYVEGLLKQWRTEGGKRKGMLLTDDTIKNRLALLEQLLKVADMPPHGVLLDGSNVAVKRSERWGLAAKRR